MVVITKKRGESKDSMFRKFTRAFINEDIIDDVRKKQFYKKPSLLRKEKEKERRQSKFKRPIRRITFRKS
jgi:small subunit ribosomal protein S21